MAYEPYLSHLLLNRIVPFRMFRGARKHLDGREDVFNRSQTVAWWEWGAMRWAWLICISICVVYVYDWARLIGMGLCYLNTKDFTDDGRLMISARTDCVPQIDSLRGSTLFGVCHNDDEFNYVRVFMFLKGLGGIVSLIIILPLSTIYLLINYR